MFTLFKSKPAEVFTHWYVLQPDFQASADEFYSNIETELQARIVPGLEVSRVDFAEGGLISDKRTYLRMIRERLVFDVCAAPFGTSYFFSLRFAEIPIKIGLFPVLALFFLVIMLFFAFVRYFGLFFGPIVLAGALGFSVWLLRNLPTVGLQDFDTMLIRSPIVGGVYERFFRKETYYRQDTRLMYHDTVNEIVKTKVEQIIGAKGIKLLRLNLHSPFMEELYKPQMVSLDDNPTTA